jgi:hypothetical protein
MPDLCDDRFFIMIIKALLVWALIALAETLHGIARIRFLNRRLGDRRARQVSVFTGTLIILIIAWFTVPWIGPESTMDSLVVGGVWLVTMLLFDIGLGRLYFHFSWKRILGDFDITKGGFLGLGMIVMFLAPLLVTLLGG